ncbi:hydroxyisourate hydrolase [uncultured Enterovirga sp.]|uniref:hydroxyisourate hydrolase n=1 Tax=uncultured Enterovirga sp. TaxID=2026352 RepID=UPI0035CBBC84
MSGLTTHALDVARGRPATGLRVALWFLGDDGDALIREMLTNDQGRTDEPLLGAAAMKAGRFRLVFALGDYQRSLGGPAGPFEEAPVQFRISRPDEHHHVPLLIAPFSYSTYRGS